MALVVVFAAGAAGRADTIKLANKPPFRKVQLCDFRNGRLVFRGLSGQELAKPLEHVETFAIDAQPRLTAAEQAATRADWSKALDEYAGALARVRESWLRDLIQARRLRAAEAAGRFDEAVRAYTELVQSWPAAPRPTHAGAVGSDLNREARALAEHRLTNAAGPAVVPLRVLLLELLLYEDVDPLPPQLVTTGSKSFLDNNLNASSRPATDEPIGLIPAEPLAPTGRALKPPAAEGQPRPSAAADAPTVAGPVRLTTDSLVLRAARQACEQGDYSRAARLVSRALPYVGPADQGPWLLVLGRAQIELGAAANAASELMTLAENGSDSIAAEALYYVGVAHERLGRTDVAAKLYAELELRAGASDELKARARERRRQLDAATDAATLP